MSLERVIRVIMGLGLSEFDAKVYVFLASNGPQNAKQVIAMMKQSKQQIYRSLKRLEKNNVVLASREFPAVFSADSFEKVLDLLSIKKEGQAIALEKLRKDLLNSWQGIIAENSANVPSNFNKRNKTEKEADC